MSASPWWLSDRFAPAAVDLSDRHYSRQKPGTNQFMPPGRAFVLITADGQSVWGSSWPEFRSDQWAGAWINSIFRKEGDGLASDMIRHAVAHTRARWPQVPALGMVTFIDPGKVRHKRDPGRCYLRAGFRRVGVSPKGLIVLQMLPGDMPEPEPAAGTQLALLDRGSLAPPGP